MHRPAGEPRPGFSRGCEGRIGLRHRVGSTVDAVVSAHPLQGGDGRFQGRVMAVQRWDRRPVIADRAFEQRRFTLGVYDPDLRFLWGTSPPAV